MPHTNEDSSAACPLISWCGGIDYHLADMNGIEVYDSLQGRKELREVPALLLSASTEKHAEELQQRQLVGLPKPFELDELLETVARLLMSGAKVGCQ